MERSQTGAVAPTYKTWSIINLLCCCLPLGIVALIYSNKVETANAAGDTALAMEASKTAKVYNIFALVCGVILIIIVITVQATNISRLNKYQ